MKSRALIALTGSLAAVTVAAAGTVVALSNDGAATATARTPLFVVGTSDVSDSDLMREVIEPGFEAAHPEYDLRYSGVATGAALATAATGAAAALIVHAPSLETRFVADGYSAEPYGRAVFWGDYILAGPRADPAGVLDGSAHDIVTAFEKIAAAGSDGRATFVSRGGTPGTTVAEHGLWALTDPAIVTTCSVTASDGGGASPYSITGACPETISAATAAAGREGFPRWYRTTGLTQAANITAASACTLAGAPRDSCYVFTDRGTFQHQESVGATGNLIPVTRTNAATARGGIKALVNSFHAYVVDPDAPRFAAIADDNLKTDVRGATTLLDWITSPAGQDAIGRHQPDDPAFVPSAAPAVTVDPTPPQLTPRQQFRLSGRLANVVPGMPPLAGVTVALSHGDNSVTTLTARTDASGRFTFGVTAPAAGEVTYRVSTDRITLTEDSTLTPPFRDLLSPTSVTLSPIRVSTAPGSP